MWPLLLSTMILHSSCFADQSVGLYRNLPDEAKLGCRTMLGKDPLRFTSSHRRLQRRQEMLSQVQEESRRQLFKIPRVGRSTDDDGELSFSNFPSSYSSLSSSSSSFLPKRSSSSSLPPGSSFHLSQSSSPLSTYSLPASQSASSSDYLRPSHSSPSSSFDSSLNEDQIKEMIFGTGTRDQRHIQAKIPRVGRSQPKTEEEVLF